MSQVKAILNDLKSGARITPLEALHKYGSLRLGARIDDLKRLGYNIDKEMIHDKSTGKRYARYYLKPSQLLLEFK